MSQSSQKPSMVTDKWNEIIEDLWEHLHFQDEKYVYDDSCLKLDCVTLQYVDEEESYSDSEPWPHQDASDVKHAQEKVNETRNESKMAKFLFGNSYILLVDS